MEDKVEVCILFHKEDTGYLRGLKSHLSSMETKGLITVWDATQITGGMEWKREIEKHLSTASIILLLVSADFMVPGEVFNLAMQALAKNDPPGIHTIPVLLRAVDWEDSDLGKLSPLPSNGIPVRSWTNRDDAYRDIATGIRKIVTASEALKAKKITTHQLATTSHEVKTVKILPAETEKAIIPLDQLEYRLEDQPWHASKLPPIDTIDGKQVSTLRSEVDIVIITANNEELKAAMHKLQPYPPRRKVLLAYIGPETYYIGKFGAFKTVVTRCRMGSGIDSGSVTLATMQAQETWHPKAILMVGIAFGKDATEQKIGDVLVASQIIPYEGQRVGEQVVFRSPIPPSNPVLLNRFESALTWHFERPDGQLCRLRVGPILSGEKLVDDRTCKAQLFQQFPQAIGGEMEGAGLCAASGRVGVPWILIKSICDWGDGTKRDLYQPLAAAAATSLVHHVLSQKTVLDAIKK